MAVRAMLGPSLEALPAQRAGDRGHQWRVLEGSLHRVFGKRAARLRERVRSFSRVDVPLRIDGNAFARRSLIDPVVALERGDERDDALLVDRTDADSVSPV